MAKNVFLWIRRCVSLSRFIMVVTADQLAGRRVKRRAGDMKLSSGRATAPLL